MSSTFLRSRGDVSAGGAPGLARDASLAIGPKANDGSPARPGAPPLKPSPPRSQERGGHAGIRWRSSANTGMNLKLQEITSTRHSSRSVQLPRYRDRAALVRQVRMMPYSFIIPDMASISVRISSRSCGSRSLFRKVFICHPRRCRICTAFLWCEPQRRGCGTVGGREQSAAGRCDVRFVQFLHTGHGSRSATAGAPAPPAAISADQPLP